MSAGSGRSPLRGSGHSAEPEPCSTVSAVPASVPNAELPLAGGAVPRIHPEDGIEGLAYSADFPSRTMTFHVPRWTLAVPGIYEIKWVRQATREEQDEYLNLPDPFRCPDCGVAQ